MNPSDRHIVAVYSREKPGAGDELLWHKNPNELPKEKSVRIPEDGTVVWVSLEVEPSYRFKMYVLGGDVYFHEIYKEKVERVGELALK